MRARGWVLVWVVVGVVMPGTVGAGWRYATPMPHGRMDFGAVYDGEGKIYVMGGNVFDVMPHRHSRCYREGMYSTLVYDIRGDRWEYLEPVPGVAALDSTFMYYDEAGKEWRYGSKKQVVNRETGELSYEMPEEYRWLGDRARNSDMSRFGAGVRIARLKDGRILWTGGRRHVGNSERVVLSFDPSQGRWCRVKARRIYESYGWRLTSEYDPPVAWMQERRILHEAVTTSDGKVYVMGGWRVETKGGDKDYIISPQEEPTYINDSVECYDPGTNTWTYRRPMRSPRFFFAAVVLGDDRILVFGGETADERHYRNFKVLDVVEEYDPRQDRWREVGRMPEARKGHAAALGSDGKVYITGGARIREGRIENTTWVYDPVTGGWERGPGMRRARHGHRMVAVPGRVCAIGGTDYEGEGFRRLANEYFLPRWFQVYEGKVQETVEVLEVDVSPGPRGG